jgi:uncharacterized protein
MSGQAANGLQAPTTDAQDRITSVERIFSKSGLQVIKPTTISAPLEFREAAPTYKVEADFELVQQAVAKFIQEHPSDNGKVYEWQDGNNTNFGVLKVVGGIVENHYIAIEVS